MSNQLIGVLVMLVGSGLLVFVLFVWLRSLAIRQFEFEQRIRRLEHDLKFNDDYQVFLTNVMVENGFNITELQKKHKNGA